MLTTFAKRHGSLESLFLFIYLFFTKGARASAVSCRSVPNASVALLHPKHKFVSFGQLTFQDCFFRAFPGCRSYYNFNTTTLKYLCLEYKVSLLLFAASQTLSLLRIHSAPGTVYLSRNTVSCQVEASAPRWCEGRCGLSRRCCAEMDVAWVLKRSAVAGNTGLLCTELTDHHWGWMVKGTLEESRSSRQPEGYDKMLPFF